MLFCFWLLLWSFWQQPLSWASPKWLDTARAYVGVRETEPNCSPVIRRFLAHVGLPCGYAWCAAFVAYCLDAGGATYPTVRSPLARKYITAKSIPVKHVLKGYRAVEPGWLAIWTRSETWTGHVGFVERVLGRDLVQTIEGNTGAASLRDGDGVWRRQRRLYEVGEFLRITHFTPCW